MARKDLASQQVFSKFSENGNKHLVCGRSCCEKITQTKHVEKLFGLFSDVGSTPTVSTKKNTVEYFTSTVFFYLLMNLKTIYQPASLLDFTFPKIISVIPDTKNIAETTGRMIRSMSLSNITSVGLSLLYLNDISVLRAGGFVT